MRNPNNWGTVVKLSGNRRKPWAVRKSFGVNEKGQPILKAIGYAATKEEGMQMLARYNAQPFDLDAAKITFSDLYTEWRKRPNNLSDSTLRYLHGAFNHSSELHDMPYKQIRAYHMQNIINKQKLSMQQYFRNLYVHLDKYAAEIEVIAKSYSQFLVLAPIAPSKEKTVFTKDEIDKVWAIKDEPYADTILFLLYTGYRVGEMLALKKENVDLVNGILKGGNKTKAGKNKVVPIHSKIYDIVTAHYNTPGNYMFVTPNGHMFFDTNYRLIWQSLMDTLNFNHTPHECRHTFRTELGRVTNDVKAINVIMGHTSNDTGLDVYTHKTLEELKNVVELITY